MYDPDCRHEYERQQRESYWSHHMEDSKKEGIKKISRLVTPYYAEKMASILAWAYDQGDEDAKDIAYNLWLTHEEMLALHNQTEEYIECHEKENDEREVEAAYERSRGPL